MRQEGPMGLGQALSGVLRGEPAFLRDWLAVTPGRAMAGGLLLSVVGGACFGVALGGWNSPRQALYAALKLPLVLCGTAVGNGLINGLLAPLLGLDLGVRRSLAAVLTGVGICGAILGGIAAPLGFLAWSGPPPDAPGAMLAHHLLLLLTVGGLAAAGLWGNVRLHQLLVALGGSRQIANRVLGAWLAMNLLLGSQLAWILRPFVGSPGLEVQFLRSDALHGSFFESVWHSFRSILAL